MRFLIRISLAICLLAFTTSAFTSGAQPVDMKYAGFGHDLAMDTNDDGYNANLTVADGKGTFGRSDMAITVEFVPDESLIGNCPDDSYIAFAVVPENYWAFVVTAADHSQVFGLFNTGWLCMTGDHLAWEGQSSGIYVGGTGRYTGVSGTWVSTFQGANLDAVTGLRSITGEVHGMLYFD